MLLFHVINYFRPLVNKTVHGIAMQIKLLMAIPEQVWSSIDEEDFMTATQLFLLARHIYTGILINIPNACIHVLLKCIMYYVSCIIHVK